METRRTGAPTHSVIASCTASRSFATTNGFMLNFQTTDMTWWILSSSLTGALKRAAAFSFMGLSDRKRVSTLDFFVTPFLLEEEAAAAA